MFRRGLSALFPVLVGLAVMGCNDSDRSKASAPIGPDFQITTTSLPDATENSSYDATIATANGVGPYTWAVTGNSLPAGLSLGVADGRVTGTPTTSGNFSFRVSVTDGTGDVSDKYVSLDVGGVPVEFLPGNPFPNGLVADAYTLDLLTKITGGTGPYTFTVVSGALPPGLTLLTNGEVHGTPTTAGDYSLIVQVTSSADPVTGSGSVAQKGTIFTIDP